MSMHHRALQRAAAQRWESVSKGRRGSSRKPLKNDDGRYAPRKEELLALAVCQCRLKIAFNGCEANEEEATCNCGCASNTGGSASTPYARTRRSRSSATGNTPLSFSPSPASPGALFLSGANGPLSDCADSRHTVSEASRRTRERNLIPMLVSSSGCCRNCITEWLCHPDWN